jgi:hypothetical protein
LTEKDWLAFNSPEEMFGYLGDDYSRRKLRLFACACARRVWHLLPDERSRDCVLVTEKYADGLASEVELRAANWDTVNREHPTAWYAVWHVAKRADENASYSARWFATRKDEASLLRDIAGNPFRPLAYPCCEGVRRIERVPGDAATLEGGQCRKHGRTWSLNGAPWLTETVLSLAKAAYDERSRQCERCRSKGRWWRCPCCKGEWAGDVGPDCFVCGAPSLTGVECDVCRGAGRIEEGTLKPARLAILADALEEAGCTALPLLEHLRSPGPHVRGCWALDLILGRA